MSASCLKDRSILRSRVRVGESHRHGRGLFERKRLRTGEFIAEFRGKPTSQEGLLVENELR